MEAAKELPEAVARAVNIVMAQVKGLLKTEENQSAGYRFASIDDFLAAVSPLCADAGLVILQDELDARLVSDGVKLGDRSWLWVTFSFMLAHTSGATYGPLTRSVMVPAEGAQAFGAAQSYALKQFMRSLFQIPTGDQEDADLSHPRRISGKAKRGELKRANRAVSPNIVKTNGNDRPKRSSQSDDARAMPASVAANTDAAADARPAKT